MQILDVLKGCEGKALVFGIGGGGDIVSTIPVANFLSYFGLNSIHGSVVWDRIVVDPNPGPRKIEELENAEVVNDVVAIANERTRAMGVELTVSRAAKHFGKVIALDINKGARKLAEGIRDFCDKEGISVVVGVDAGGDAIAVGYESGIKSPLSDSMCVAALKHLADVWDGKVMIAVTGFGSDGELKFEELLLNISILMRKREFLGCSAIGERDYEEMKKLTSYVVTEASKIPLMAFDGEIGLKKIRKSRTVLVTPLSALVFYFTASGVFELNEIAQEIIDAASIEEANARLKKFGVFTELDFERAVSEHSE